MGTYAIDAGTLDGGIISYQCCDGLGFPLVDIRISQFQIQSGGTVLRPLPMQDGNTLTASVGPTCPGGAFSYERTLTGGCTSTYRLVGNFVGPDTFVGTYTAAFVGADCSGALCGGNACTNQSWNISAGR